jgi:coenzyme F420-dependent glucose-6-phosphate dehydrogenase
MKKQENKILVVMKCTIAYHASHEQFKPSHLLQLVKMAEDAGFEAIHSSDHFHPWSERQGQSGFTFSWIAAALQATTLPFSMVCAPGQRYHPAIVAQAIATLCEMFPRRFTIELGSGEAINEMITGTLWPQKESRNERLLECFKVISKLLKGEKVTFHGHINVSNAKLYTLPGEMPSLFCAAISEETAQWAGSWADGLITTGGSTADLKNKVIAFRQSAGRDIPVYVQYAFSYHRSKQKAINEAFDQWRTMLLPREKLADLCTVNQFDDAGETITVDDVAKKLAIYTSIEELKEKIEEYKETGVNRIILHNVNLEQEQFIEDFKINFHS